jgi:predicted amidophosphoribosyltransferase
VESDLAEASEILDVSISEVIEISEELKEEMKTLESQEEQGKECLVCGAIFGPEDMLCPVCGIEYGIEIEEPKVPEPEWGHIEVEVPPTIRTCPNCGSNVTGLDATEREVKEGKWFYRGLITIFTGIFFTSFSIWARGISVENESLGLNPPPTDVILNIFGWILVLLGFMFWFMSWRLHGERTECPECGIETEPNMMNCINCGVVLSEDAEEAAEEPADEEEAPKEDTNSLDTLTLPPRRHADMPIRKKETVAEPEIQEIPEDEMPELGIPEDEIPEIEVPAEPEVHSHGEELPTEHVAHKKCPGCGIYVDLGDNVCPVCDTEFAPEPEAALKPDIDNITVPDSSAPHIECPSCGADVPAGTKACPVCEYPLP